MARSDKVLTTDQAMHRLNISRGTFFTRIKEHGIKPANYNPNLKKQHNPVWRQADVDTLGVPINVEDGEEPQPVIAA
jgi:predicted DNA-binding transcriptional regulator AlpA